jgi:tyrosyl-tRNA synthetase
MKCIKMLTFLPLEEIEAMEAWDDSRINEKKEILAYELTALVHGEEEANKAKETSRNLFKGAGNSADMPTTELSEADLTDGKIGILDVMVKGKLAPSRSEAKRLVIQGGVVMDDVKVEAFNAMIDAEALKNGIVIRKGKKVFHKFILK